MLLMSNGSMGRSINWTDVFNGFNAGSTFARNSVQNVRDINSVLQPSPANVAGIEGATFTGSAWNATGLTPQHTIMGVAKYGAGFKGYLNEPSRSNLVYPSRDFTGARWTSTNVTTAKDQTGPDGVANSACSVTATANNGTLASTATVSASSAKAGSFFIKRITGTGTVEISVDSGTSYTDVTTLINSTTYTQVAALATSTNPQLIIRLGTSGDAIAADYAQVEVGAFATSPITTTTAAFTRPVSNLSRPTSGVLPVNNFGIWLRWYSAAVQAKYIATAYYDASNYITFLQNAGDVRVRKRVGGVSTDTQALTGYPQAIGWREAQYWQSSSGGHGIRVKGDGAAWSAWGDITTAAAKADNSFIGAALQLLAFNNAEHLSGNCPFLAILTDADPKSKLELAATLYPTS